MPSPFGEAMSTIKDSERRRNSMKRKSEIIRAAYEHTTVAEINTKRVDGFINGAEWMLEKIEQWLTKSGRGQMIGSLHRFLEEE